MWIFALLPLLGCTGTDVGSISGTVLVGPGVAGPRLTEGTVTILNANGEPFDEAPLDAQGRFAATAPLGSSIHALVEGPGLVPAAFSGTMGLGAFEVPPGVLFGWPEADRAALDLSWAGCARPGPVLVGEARILQLTDDDGSHPLVTTGWAHVQVDGERVEGCYLGADGVHDPLAEVTGDRGAFALFGLPPGLVLLEYGYHATPAHQVEAALTLYVPEDGVTPLFPAWLDFFLP